MLSASPEELQKKFTPAALAACERLQSGEVDFAHFYVLVDYRLRGNDRDTSLQEATRAHGGVNYGTTTPRPIQDGGISDNTQLTRGSGPMGVVNIEARILDASLALALALAAKPWVTKLAVTDACVCSSNGKLLDGEFPHESYVYTTEKYRSSPEIPAGSKVLQTRYTRDRAPA